MLNELCIRRQCKTCPNQRKCFRVCEHNYILVKENTQTNTYKCIKCGSKITLTKDDICITCVKSCKGKIKTPSINGTGKTKLCSGFKEKK